MENTSSSRASGSSSDPSAALWKSPCPAGSRGASQPRGRIRSRRSISRTMDRLRPPYPSGFQLETEPLEGGELPHRPPDLRAGRPPGHGCAARWPRPFRCPAPGFRIAPARRVRGLPDGSGSRPTAANMAATVIAGVNWHLEMSFSKLPAAWAIHFRPSGSGEMPSPPASSPARLPRLPQANGCWLTARIARRGTAFTGGRRVGASRRRSWCRKARTPSSLC